MTADMTARIRRSFSRSFVTYHEHASQQRWIAGKLIEVMRANGAPDHFRSALELGCGTGHLTQQLRAYFGFDRLSVNDLSASAAETARIAGAEFICGDAMRIGWPHQPDLIASASMLQWLDEPSRLLRKSAAALAPGGWLAMSGFGPEQYRELVLIESAASRAPGLSRAKDLAAALGDDIEILASGEAVRKMRFPTPLDVLEHLRHTGVNGRARRVWTRGRFLRFSLDYKRYFGNSAGVSLTYHPVWIIARKRY